MNSNRRMKAKENSKVGNRMTYSLFKPYVWKYLLFLRKKSHWFWKDLFSFIFVDTFSFLFLGIHQYTGSYPNGKCVYCDEVNGLDGWQTESVPKDMAICKASGTKRLRFWYSYNCLIRSK